MDIKSRKLRSLNMSKIRSKNTKPELIVRSIIHKKGFRFRLHVSGLPGKPDLVFPKYKNVIFIHGCFWHRHENCKYSYMPKSNIDFWKNKFSDNVRKFKKARNLLKKSGWRVIVLWECEIENKSKLEKKLQLILKNYF
jgi:DNA mismatch endonuclease (patch repair protein)